MSMGSVHVPLLVQFYMLILLAQICIAADMLYPSQTLGDGETLVSAGEQFRLGFFSTGKSNNRYLGIWYNNTSPQNNVWVANRDSPLNDSSGILKMGNDGNLVLLDHMERVVWSSDVQNLSAKSKVAQLLDSGNFVLRDESSTGDLESYLWQSFNQHSDTLLAGMKLGWDLRTGLNLNLTSWISEDDPSPGNFTYGIDLHRTPQLVIRKGSIKQFRTGIWNGVYFNGMFIRYSSLFFHYRIIYTPESIFFTYYVNDKSTITNAVLNPLGMLQRKVWSNKTLEWDVMYTIPSDSCDNYGRCGPNGICTISDDKLCSCFTGYTPKSPQDWDMLIWSGGCIRNNPLNCPRGEGFIELQNVKMPDLLQFWVNNSITFVECEAACLKNCSCTAYTYMNATGAGSSCLLWFGDLIDVRKIAEYGNDTLFFRVTASDLAANARKTLNGSPGKKKILVISMVAAVLGALLLISCYCYQWRRHAKKKAKKKNQRRREMLFSQSAFSLSDHKDTSSSSRAEENKNVELAFFGLETVIAATNNFSPAKMLGRGGFGTVYKGQLSNGQEIAVKRLSKKSRQGIVEFKNEVLLIANLQHRNLVRLLGCCIEDDEKILIYEYMPNKSLDYFIVDQSRKLLLDWKKRSDIIVGIARGILYLHQDSRLRIIHRDLKTSNVLLDAEMKPKISDFGLARMFKGDQIQDKTKRVVGTYGYMSPEYAVFGKYSIKSDVFSFGIILLEIVSGKKNNNSCPEDSSPNLIGSVWELWGEDRALSIVDPSLESYPSNEVLRCIQVGLLCVQEDATDRPTMSTVVLMLNSETTTLPSPKQPAFVFRKNCSDPGSLNSRVRSCSVNEVTITKFEAR